MIEYTLSITTTAEQDAALNWLLTTRNADAVHVDKPLADVQALLTEMLQTAIEDAVPAFQSARKASIVTALDQATAADWDAVETQLKVPLSGKRT
jgi:hypothetical protein